MNSQLKELENFCLLMCVEAKKIIEKDYNEKNKINHKENNDVVTFLDQKIEKFVRKKIQENYPMHEVSGEEYGYSKRGTSDYEWIIDPIDGTVNFINNLEFSSFSIALKCKGETIVGAVYDFNNEVTYHAIKGVGSFKNGELLTPNKREEKSKKDLSVSLLLPQHYSPEIKKKNIELLHLLYENSLSVRVLTCHSLELIYLALGKFDATICIKTRGTSSAAAALFLQELNGRIYKSRFIIKDTEVVGLVACTKNSSDIIIDYIKETGGEINS